MSLTILLDSGPLGLVTNPTGTTESEECYLWMMTMITLGNHIIIPEIADYEVRRELIRAGKVKSLSKLDDLQKLPKISYLPLTTPVMLRAAEFWAQARQQGKATADPKALDGDVILAAQAISLVEQGRSTVIATMNVGHLTLFVDARHWRDIA